MLKGQPKGLFVLALANMGERFGYYTMLAIFVLFMQAKFGFNESTTSTIFGTFLAAVYFLPLIGGLIADKVLGYGKTIALGIVVMFSGYLLLAIPSGTDNVALITMIGALLLIAMGTGFFKGNLQALVGNLYDDPKYAPKRDVAFSIFYMCINIGAFFAPSAADTVSGYFMSKDNFKYDARVSSLYHQYVDKHNITPDGFVNFSKAATANNANVADFDKFQAMLEAQNKYFRTDTVNTDSVNRLTPPSLNVVYGALLSNDQVDSVRTYLDSILIARYTTVAGIDTANVEGNLTRLRMSVVGALAAQTDTASLRVQLTDVKKKNYALVGTAVGADTVIYFTPKQSTAMAKVQATLNAAVDEQVCAVIDGEKLAAFGESYTLSLTKSYNYGFAVACFSLIVSMLIFLAFRKYYKQADQTHKQKEKAGANEKVLELTKEQTKERMVALGLVFAVVIFFWMAFHQNGLTMTFFARDYTQSTVTGLDRFAFSLLTLLPFAVFFYGALGLFQSKGKSVGSLVALFVGAGLAYWGYTSFPQVINITPQIFQQFNAYFIVILTPVAVATFAWLASKNREPLAPRKIGIGMIIAAMGFVVLAIGSLGLPTPDAAKAAGGVDPDMMVSPNWLISTYFVLTIAELFLSPMGISFVSKVAPPKYKGLAQGGWLAATAIGNYLVAIIGYLWGDMQLWMLWGILVTCCLLSAVFLFSQMKRLENTTRNA